MIRKLFNLLILIVILLGAGTFYVYSSYKKILETPISDRTDKKVFIVDEGMSADEILVRLGTEDILDAKQIVVMKVYIRYEKKPAFKEGTFRLPLNLNLIQLTEALETPELTDLWVTIPEGLRKDEIAKVIAKEFATIEDSVFSEKEFLALTKDQNFIFKLGLAGIKDLEGYLFPDKYLFPAQATTEYVITTLVDTFNKKAGEISYENLIIASMLEREGLTDQDRPMIADVIKRRQKEGWLLQIDATLLYYYKDWKHVITVQDKELDQPYNTYKRLGLPPTPISNPGLSSINAAKNPKKNPYYFYIHADDGNVYFAQTLAQHEANIAKYLR